MPGGKLDILNFFGLTFCTLEDRAESPNLSRGTKTETSFERRSHLHTSGKETREEVLILKGLRSDA